MKKNLLAFFLLIIVGIAFVGCDKTTSAGNYPDNSETNEGGKDDDITIFDKIISGKPLNDIESLFNFSDEIQVEGYTILAGCPYHENAVLAIYGNGENALAIVYDVSDLKEEKKIEMDGISFSKDAEVYSVSEEFAYIIDISQKQLVYLSVKDEKYEVISLEFIPDSIVVMDEGEQFFYTMEDDCNIYQYTKETGNTISVFDASEIVSDIQVKYSVSGSNILIVKMESPNYSGYASLSLENQELSPLENISGELLYSGDGYVYTSPEKKATVIIYNPMTPRLTKEFRLEETDELNNIMLFQNTPYILSMVDTDEGTMLRFYDVDEGIMENCIVIPDNYNILGIKYFDSTDNVFLQVTDEKGDREILIWNTDLIENIIE